MPHPVPTLSFEHIARAFAQGAGPACVQAMQVSPGARSFLVAELSRRLERAAALLRSTDWSVARVGTAVGFASIGSFTTSFGRTYGLTPTAYRAAHPPAAGLARVPACVVRSWSRPQVRTFREDAAAPHPVD